MRDAIADALESGVLVAEEGVKNPKSAINNQKSTMTLARRILKRLRTQGTNAPVELSYTNPFELLVATILSAQCTE